MLFLPQYSPDLNPIEMTSSKLKAHLRKPQLGPSMPSATSATCSNPANAKISLPQLAIV